MDGGGARERMGRGRERKEGGTEWMEISPSRPFLRVRAYGKYNILTHFINTFICVMSSKA